MIELKETIIKLRSIRKFSNREVPKDAIEEIVLAANWAPSACNYQLWKFIVIDDPKIKEMIFEQGGASFIKDAPVGILVLYDNRSDNLEYRDYIQSAAAAIQNMLLAATSLGIGSCWVCHLPPKSVLRRLLKIPAYFDPIAYIPLGYPLSEVKPHPRKNALNDIISWNKFTFQTQRQSIFKLIVKRLLKRTYLYSPFFLKKALRPLAERFVKKFD